MTHVPLSLLRDFQKDVSDFLQGSKREVDPSNVMISIESGSLQFVATGLLVATSLMTDIRAINSSQTLTSIDPKRIAVITRWQKMAIQNPNRRYRLFNHSLKLSIDINSKTNFHELDEVWVSVEKYVFGRIVDMGGKKDANVHVELDNGKSLKIASSQKLLAVDEKNRLYRPALLHINAEENLITGEMRNMNLIEFETHQPKFDQEEFDQLLVKGKKAWSDVQDVNEWIEFVRGGKI